MWLVTTCRAAAARLAWVGPTARPRPPRRDQPDVAARDARRRRVAPRILRDAGLEVAERLVGAHPRIVREAELVLADVGRDDRGVVADRVPDEDRHARRGAPPAAPA